MNLGCQLLAVRPWALHPVVLSVSSLPVDQNNPPFSAVVRIK